VTVIRRGTYLALVLPFIASSEMAAQRARVTMNVRPALRGTLGPITVRAAVGRGGIGVRIDRRPRAGVAAPAGAPAARAETVLRTADRHVGAPYEWGGTTPAGFDCSGFVQYVFRRHGVELPRTSRQQVQVGRAVRKHAGALAPGDLMFFASDGGRIDHVAIYVGGGRMLHATASGGGVRYDSLAGSRGRWFSRRHVASRRVLANGTSLVQTLDAALRAGAAFDAPDGAPRVEIGR
jgi:cell wall-associated NlpC family hydrolase